MWDQERAFKRPNFRENFTPDSLFGFFSEECPLELKPLYARLWPKNGQKKSRLHLSIKAAFHNKDRIYLRRRSSAFQPVPRPYSTEVFLKRKAVIRLTIIFQFIIKMWLTHVSTFEHTMFLS
jgi:hypothetical protein